MAKLGSNRIFFGKGRIRYHGEDIGVADEVAFTVTELGLRDSERELSCYGTIDGIIKENTLIPELNSPNPTPVDLLLTLEDGEKVTLKNVEVIDQIPSSGELKRVEFHGPWEG